MMQPMMQFIGNLGYVVVSMLGGWLAIRGRIGVEAIIQSFIQYVRMLHPAHRPGGPGGQHAPVHGGGVRAGV